MQKLKKIHAWAQMQDPLYKNKKKTNNILSLLQSHLQYVYNIHAKY